MTVPAGVEAGETGRRDFPHLLSTFALGPLTLRNRIVFQPHFTALPDDLGMPTDDLEAYFLERAIGGAGLIVDGHFAVMPEGVMSRRNVHAWDPAIVPKYREITRSVRAAGAPMIAQLTHGGHTTLFDPPFALWAPSQMPEPSSRHTTRAMDHRDIRRTIDAFAQSARTVVGGGFDGIEVKIAHDGLLRSFASPFFNRRVDAYGGSFERRLRLPVEVLEGVRDAIGPGRPLGVRLCLHEYTPFGYELEYGLRIAEHLESRGLVDYFNCDAGSFSSFWMEIPPAAVEQGFFRPLNRALKERSSLPVVAFGRIKDAGLAERILELGEADLIGMARQLIADPDTPRKLVEGRSDEIRACVGCNDGCLHQVMQVEGIRCIQNPAAGQERRYSERLLTRAQVSRRVVVVGAGVAGLKVAEIAARRGHRVTLLERSGDVGGQVRLAARQPLHQELGEVVAYLEAAVARLGVELWLHADAEVEGLLDLEPEAIVVATGSQPDLPRVRSGLAGDRDEGAVARAAGLQVPSALPGLDRPCVRSVDEVLAGSIPRGSAVLLVDAHGHWEAAGTAEFLADQGCSVDVVTSAAEVGARLEATNRVLFHQRARAKGIRMSPMTDVIEIRDECVRLAYLGTGEERRLTADFVVPVLPRLSRDDLFYRLLERIGDGPGPSVARVGDASVPQLVQTILLEAQQLAMEL